MRILLSLLLLGMAYNLARADESEAYAKQRFQELKALAGEWKPQGADGQAFYISFTETAGGSVLVENWIYKGESHSLTLYHLDGDTLLATHYCPQGNQPRLRLQQSENIEFVFQDATNLPTPATNHQHSLGFRMVDDSTLVREETYREGDKVEPSSLELVRR